MATKVETQPINEEKLNAFLGKVVGDFGASLSSTLVYIGLKLGLYQAMAGGFTQFRRATETPFNRIFEARR